MNTWHGYISFYVLHICLGYAKNIDIRFANWIMMIFFRPQFLKTVAREMGNTRLYFVKLHEGRWNKEGTDEEEINNIF